MHNSWNPRVGSSPNFIASSFLQPSIARGASLIASVLEPEISGIPEPRSLCIPSRRDRASIKGTTSRERMNVLNLHKTNLEELFQYLPAILSKYRLGAVHSSYEVQFKGCTAHCLRYQRLLSWCWSVPPTSVYCPFREEALFLDTHLDAIKRRIDSEPTNTSEYWKWFALCLYTMQPPLRADWASFSIIETSDTVPSTGNHLILTAHKATILIRDDKVSKRKGGAQIPVTAELHAVLLESVSTFPRSVVVPHTKSSRKALQLSYTPDKHISKVNLSKLLGQAMASEQDNTPWPRPIQGLRKAHSTLVVSSNASYHTMKQVADAQRHSLSTMLCHYNAVPPSCSVEDGHKARSPEERIASAIQQNGLSHSNIIIIMTPCAESHGNESPAWTLYCSNPELQESAEQGLAIIQDSCISGSRRM